MYGTEPGRPSVRSHASGRVPRPLGVAPDNHPTLPLGRPLRSGAPDPLVDTDGPGRSPHGPSEGWRGGHDRAEPRPGADRTGGRPPGPTPPSPPASSPSVPPAPASYPDTAVTAWC